MQCSHYVGKLKSFQYCVTKRDSFLPSFNLDVNECTVYKPCKNGGTCVNTVGDYNCQCPDNYKGKNCDEGWLECRVSYHRCFPCKSLAAGGFFFLDYPTSVLFGENPL